MTSSRRLSRLTCLAAALALAGCGYNDPITAVGPTATLGRVMVVQGSPDTPTFDAWLDGKLTGSTLDYLSNSAYLATPQANIHVQLIVPTSPIAAADTVLDTLVPVAAGNSYTLFAADSLSRLSPVILTDDLSTPPSGTARVRFVHCLPSSGPVDFAVTGGSVLAPGVPFKGTAGWQLVGAGSYDLEARPAGDATTQIASVQGLVFSAGHVYTVWLYGPVGKNAPSVPGLETIVNQ